MEEFSADPFAWLDLDSAHPFLHEIIYVTALSVTLVSASFRYSGAVLQVLTHPQTATHPVPLFAVHVVPCPYPLAAE
jgi:ABC-type cobalamin transport system permease subunit